MRQRLLGLHNALKVFFFAPTNLITPDRAVVGGCMQIRHSWVFLVLLFCFMMASCASKISMEDTTERNGLLYQRNHDDPYTGYVVGRAREGYRQKIYSFKKEYKDGLLNGKTEYYYSNGKLESVENYKKGELDGIVTRYYEGGQIKARIHFINGERGGGKGEFFWDPDGNIIKG
jgi:hypothetical protein